MALLFNRFVGEGLYLLDEPEASLSPQRQLSVLTRLHDLVQHNSQFIIATHSPILMAYPNSTIYSLSTQGIERIDYYQTEHYQVTHDFLVNPQRMLDRLLDSAPRDPSGKFVSGAPSDPAPSLMSDCRHWVNVFPSRSSNR